MQTECTPKLFEFEVVERRSVVAGFDGGNITSNAGALLLGQVCFGMEKGPRWRGDRRPKGTPLVMGFSILGDVIARLLAWIACPALPD